GQRGQRGGYHPVDRSDRGHPAPDQGIVVQRRLRRGQWLDQPDPAGRRASAVPVHDRDRRRLRPVRHLEFVRQL
ncbi:MAG: hypothetical protein AVDCRST_MAG33-1755, partial [uncultured Thermomicrobiales bacterium]